MKVKIGKYPTRGNRKRKVKVELIPSDTWNLDETLAHIILPCLKQLKKTKHGAPVVDDEDVPENLRRKNPARYKSETDDDWFNRWDWIMDEMIWAFEQKIDDDGDDKFYTWGPKGTITGKRDLKMDSAGLEAHHKRMDNGFRLFGKYYGDLWD